MHFDKRNALIVMRYIEPPHIILRKSLIAGERVSSFAAHVGAFCARTLYGTSALALTGGVLRTKIAEWSRNKEMCALTEQVIFTDPYYESPINHWTAPQLDLYAAGIRNDTDLKLAAQFLKGKFLNSTQALLHADLHTGSVMVSDYGRVRVYGLALGLAIIDY
jgi:5-methylthioribose kinase